jgi:hypothetical protein
MRKCEVDGCTGQHRARGFCILHYNNWVRYESGAGKFETKFRAAEQDRIIKLLEANLDNDIETNSMFYQNAGIQTAIALIKGENK